MLKKPAGPAGFDYIITSTGKQHLDKGGYKNEFFWQLANSGWTFLLSIAVFFISLFALFY